METFAEVREYIKSQHPLDTDEPFIISFEYVVADTGRRQGIYLAELKDVDGRRYLRVETPVGPLDNFDAEKCLRINLMQRIGYLAVGDLDGIAYIKMCDNLPYHTLDSQELSHVIERIAPLADRMETAMLAGEDLL